MKKITLRPQRIFSEDLRKQIVLEYESGRFSVLELAKLHGTFTRTIYRWIYRYSTYNKKNVKVVESNDSSEMKLRELHARILQLEAALGRSQLEIEFKSKMIELAEKELGVDFKKKFADSSSKASNPSQENKESGK